MKASNFTLDAYLARIGYEGEPCPDLATLTQLMQKQLRSVPFENLDVQAGKTVSIVPEDIVAKILPTRRGGYCYEVNSLFAMALEAVGIPYYLAGARPMGFPTRRARTHMAVIATVGEEQWLCDTGYGRLAIRRPMNLAILDTEVLQDFDTYRLIIDDHGDHVVQASMPDGWDSLYGFSLAPFELSDFIPANYYNSNSPDAIFTQVLMIMRHTQTGRHILAGHSLKTYEDGHLTESRLDDDQRRQAVQDLFGIAL